MARHNEVTNEELLVRIVRLERGLFDGKDRSRIENIEGALFNAQGENRLEEIYTVLHGMKWIGKLMTWGTPIVLASLGVWKYWTQKL